MHVDVASNARSSQAATEEAEKLLSLAETYELECEDLETRITSSRLVYSIAVSATLTAPILAFLTASDPMVLSAWIFAFLIALQYVLFKSSRSGLLRSEYEISKKSLDDVLSVLQEIEGLIALDREGSTEHRALFRIRFSRLKARRKV